MQITIQNDKSLSELSERLFKHHIKAELSEDGKVINAFVEKPKITIAILATYIVDVLELDILLDCLKQQRSYADNEYKRIAEILQESTVCDSLLKMEDSVQRKMAMYWLLTEYIEDNDTIHIPGFLKFRIKDSNYMASITNIVEAALSEYHDEKEYNAFVSFLQSTMSSNSRCKYVEVTRVETDEDWDYFLCDESGVKRKVEAELTKTTMEDGTDDRTNIPIQDDFLLSTLINAAPRKIYINCHIANNVLIEILQDIFGKDNVVFGKPDKAEEPAKVEKVQLKIIKGGAKNG